MTVESDNLRSMSDINFQFISAHQRDALRQVLGDESTRVVVLLNAGEADTEVTRLIENSGKPVIAAVGGAAEGAGCRCVVACAFAVASAEATFALPVEMTERHAAVEAVGAFVSVTKQQHPAFEILTTGEAISVRQALEIGLVTQVVADRAELHEVCVALAREMSGLAPRAFTFAMEAVTGGLRLPLADALGRETELFSRCFATDDVREGIRAFYEKRMPRFLGR